MTLVASLFFAVSLAASIGAIMLTMRSAMPRISEIIELRFAPPIQAERKIVFGEIKGCSRVAAEVITFPARTVFDPGYKLAA